VARAYELVRADVAPLEKDRELSTDIAAVAARVRAGVFARLWETN
jgi:histidine ammonia-lyase